MKVCLGAVAAAMLWSPSASAQTQAPPAPPPPAVNVGAPTGSSATGLLHLDLFDSATRSGEPLVSRRVAAGIGPLWFFKTGSTFAAPGGTSATLSVVGRRGYDVPLYMTETVGTNAPTGFGLYSGTRTQYDAELRVKKTVFSRGKLHIDLIGDAILPLHVSRPSSKSPTQDPASDTLMESKTFRFGVSIRR